MNKDKEKNKPNPISVVEREMDMRDAESEAAAKRYIDRYGNEDIDAQSGMTRQKDRNALLEMFREYIFYPVSRLMRRILEKLEGVVGGFRKETEEKKTDRDLSSTLVGGAHTEGERKVRGFNKKHIIIVGSVLTVIIVSGVALGTKSSKNIKKDDNNVDRGAITGTHMNTMPKDYTELAALKKKQQAEKDKLNNEPKPHKDKEKSIKVSEEIKKESSAIKTNAVKMQDDAELQARKAALMEAKTQRRAAMSSPIRFDIKHR